MYTIEIFKEGIQYLGITDPDEILYIINARYENLVYLKEKKNEIKWEDRLKVPRGLAKKKLTELQKETQQKIYYIQGLRRNPVNNEITNAYYDLMLEDWIGRKFKIKETLNFHGRKNEYDLKKAKTYPVERLLEFNRGGFAKCLWHDEKHGSLHLDKKRNKAHCFSCGKDADSIDIYQQINNVTIGEAIKRLCQTQ